MLQARQSWGYSEMCWSLLPAPPALSLSSVFWLFSRSLMVPSPSQFTLIYSEWLLNGTLFRFAGIVGNHQFCMSSPSHLAASHTATGRFTAPAVVCKGNEEIWGSFHSVFVRIFVCVFLVLNAQKFISFSPQNLTCYQIRGALLVAQLRIQRVFQFRI